jgi:hypothetical protein
LGIALAYEFFFAATTGGHKLFLPRDVVGSFGEGLRLAADACYDFFLPQITRTK